MYVLAQFSEHTSFDWVHKIRAKTGKDETKHADVVWAKVASPGDKELWRTVDRSVEAATIYVVDPSTYVQHVVSELLADGAEYGYDFDAQTAIEIAAEQIIHDTPGYQITNTHAALEFANLTSPLGGLAPVGFASVMFQPELPIPREILTKLGGRLRDAIRFAARAQALFDTDVPDFDDLDTFPEYASGLRARVAELRVRKVLSTPRVFDTEDNHSVEVLNETAYRISGSIPGPPALRPLIREATSHGTDAIQAADIAAGIAREIIDRSGVRALAGKFRRIFVNGIDLHKLLRHS